jgi:hypothetical protein
MNYQIIVALSYVADLFRLHRMLWRVVKRNDTGNPFASTTDKRNRIGWVAWDIIDHCNHSFDGLT